jgi:hypothetical protein
MTSNILTLLDQVDTGMSPFQIEKFVINEQLTPYRQVRQALIELRARIETKAMLNLEIEELEVKVLRNIATLSCTDDDLDRRLLEIENKKYDFERDRKVRMISQLDKEASVLNDIATQLITANFTDLETFSDLLRLPEFITAQEEDYWEERLAKSAISDLINYNTLSKGTVDAILSLPKEMQSSILDKGLNASIRLTASLTSLKDLNLAKIDK